MSVLRDDRTLFLCRTRPDDRLAEMLEAAIAEAASLEPLETRAYRLNVQDGCAFAFVDPVVRNLLAGKNADGTDRVEYVDEPTKTPQELDSMSWKERHAYEKERPASGLVDLPPLITLRRPDGSSPEVYAAWCAPPPANRMHNVIRARDCPRGVTAAAIKRHFAVFASDSTTPVPRMACGKLISEPYPFVTVNAKREVFVAFDPNGYDASFALLISAVSVVSGRTLTFAHSYRTERDVAACLSRAPRVYPAARCAT